jgi:hypothetical protein
LTQSKIDEKSLVVDDDSIWDPLHHYRSKLEKLMQNATVEQAAAAKRAEEAARAREEQQQQQEAQETEIRDVDMENAASTPATDAVAVVDELVPEPEKVAGKKRLATPEEDEEGDEDHDSDKQGRSAETDEQASDNESRSSEQGVTVNETKRLRVR